MKVASVSRRAGLAALLVAGVVAAPSPASAHSRLTSTSPAAGSTVRTAPRSVSLTFNERLLGRYSNITVTGPRGATYSVGRPRQVDTTTTQDVQPLGSGQYTVAWRVVSADGHPIGGSFRFTVALARGQEPAAAPGGGDTPATPAAAPADPAQTPGESSSAGGWALGGGTALAVGALVIGLWALQRRRREHGL